MGEFEKETLRDKYDEARQKELKELLDPETGELSLKFSQYVNCPICGKEESETLFKKNGFTFVRCNDCDHVYSNPQVNEELVLQSYGEAESNDIWIDVLLTEAQRKEHDRKYNHMLPIIERFCPLKGRILELGCSLGFFLQKAKASGWDCIGLELNDRAIKYAREEFGLDVRKQILEETDFEDAYFDAVAMLGVLEHLGRPFETLQEVHKALRNGGILALEVNNVYSLAARIMHEKTFTFDGRNHLQYFCIKSLTKLLEQSGFQVAHYYTDIPSLPPILSYLSYNDPYFSERPDHFNLSPREIKVIGDIICRLDLGYRIFMFAQKM